MVIGDESNINEIYLLWKYKFQMKYDIDAFDFKDKNISKEMEDE